MRPNASRPYLWEYSVWIRFPFRKAEPFPGDGDLLLAQAVQVHGHAPRRGVVDRAVASRPTGSCR
jgi:hypothetical protein